MTKHVIFILTAIILLTSVAFADAKIKTKQTVAGQTTENTTYIKGKRTRSEAMGGAIISLTQCDLGRDIRMAPQAKTYTISYYADGTPAGTPGSGGTSGPTTKGGTMYVTTTIKDTGERKQIFGYTARHIIQTIETESSPDSCYPTRSKMEMDMWVIDAEFGVACTQPNPVRSYNGSATGGCQDKVVPKTIGTGKSGYPLYQKMTAFDATGKETMSMVQEVVELSKTTLEASLFDVPADYREVKDATSLYSQSGATSGLSYTGPRNDASVTTGTASTIKVAANNATLPAQSSDLGPKQPGTIRIGLAGVKTGAVGEGVNAADLSAAIQNSLGSFLKGTKVEIVALEARLASAQLDEAKQKGCDLVLNATASHKKGGGGGFGGFGKILGSVVAQTGIGGTGSTIGNIAGQVATQAIMTAGQFSGNVKKKDEITLDVKLTSIADNSTPLARVFTAKAKGDGDDIVSAIVEQAAQAIIEAVGK